jgi:hypothetical protein
VYAPTSHKFTKRRRNNFAISLFILPRTNQRKCLTSQIGSQLARENPRGWLKTLSSSPRGATPTHDGRWGISESRRPLPNLQTTEAPGFSPTPGRQPLLDRIGYLRLGGCPGGPIPFAKAMTSRKCDSPRPTIILKQSSGRLQPNKS